MLNFTTLIIGDDYKAANGRAVVVDFDAITGFTAGTATGKLGFSDGVNTESWTNGVTSDNGDGTWKVSFDLDQTDTGAVVAGNYEWSVEIVEGGEEITVDRAENLTQNISWVAKQT